MNGPDERNGAQAANLALRLFLISLAVLFVASLVGYVVTRASSPQAAAVVLPQLLWASTAALLAAGGLLETAWRRSRAGREQAALVLLRAAAGAALLFFGLQVPALGRLLAQHRLAADPGNPSLGFVFFLVLLHAAHVAGGLAALVRSLQQFRRRGAFSSGGGQNLRALARYWHFLDAVWLAMLAVFLVS